MARLYRSPRAKRDIADVLEYTRDRWGQAQARAYLDLIREALKSIAADPKCGKLRGARPGILSHHIKLPGRDARHVVFYRISRDSVVEIVRVLHDSMDFDQHLP
jgi:toxin ParE1/3/4